MAVLEMVESVNEKGGYVRVRYESSGHGRASF
jgi:hypothetical protein